MQIICNFQGYPYSKMCELCELCELFVKNPLSYLSLPWYKEQNRQVGFFKNKIKQNYQNYFSLS